VVLTSRDRHRRLTSEADHRQIVSHQTRTVVATAKRVPNSKRAKVVVSPALDSVVLKNRAGVIPASRYSSHILSNTKINIIKIVANSPGAAPALLNVSKTQLAIHVVAPALELPASRHSTRVSKTSRYLQCSHVRSQSNRSERVAHLVAPPPNRRVIRPNAKLPLLITPPTLDRLAPQKGAHKG